MSSFTEPLEYKFANGYYNGRPLYVITKEFNYIVGSIHDPLNWKITVPVGFVTDLASVPWPLSIFFKPDGPWAKAAVIHDFLLTYNQFDENVVPNAIFYEAMLVSKVPKLVAWCFWKITSVFGRPGYYDGGI